TQKDRQSNMLRPCARALLLLIIASQLTLHPYAAPARSVDLLITGGTVVTMDAQGRVLEDGAVAIAHGRIVEVGPSDRLARKYAAHEVLDARGRVGMPGLINGPTHVPMTLFRGIADDLDLMEWLTKYIFP